MPALRAFIVYGLVDPRTRLVRYIGKSCSGLARPRQHRTSYDLKRYAHVHRSRWVESLHQQGLCYEIVELERLGSAACLTAAERWWIAYGRGSGWPLTNHTDGGDGVPGYKHTAESIAKFSGDNSAWARATPEARERWRATQRTPEIRKSRSINNPMRRPEVVASRVNPMTRAEVRAKVTGENHYRKRHPEHNWRPPSKLNADKVREIRARFAEGERVAELASAYDVRDVAIYRVVRRETWKEI